MWFEDLLERDPSSTALVASALDVLSDHGPQLTAGDKAGHWHAWYATHIPIAERRYTAWLAENTS